MGVALSSTAMTDWRKQEAQDRKIPLEHNTTWTRNLSIVERAKKVSVDCIDWQVSYHVEFWLQLRLACQQCLLAMPIMGLSLNNS